MNLQSNLEKLEYNKILDMLKSFCYTYSGRNITSNLVPSFNKVKVQKLLNETNEASILLIRKGNIPIADIPSISGNIMKLRSEISLSTKELLEIASIFRLSRELKEYFYEDENFDLSPFVILNNLFSNLYNNLDVESEIFSAIIDENTISDNASAKLFAIRKNKKKIEDDIKESLTHILHSPSFSKVIMEPIVTIRSDRYVIPIKDEYKSQVKGFIHDISASGSTVFVEPLQVFELNNKLQELKVEENNEISHILETLSFKIMPFSKELENNVNIIGRLDFIFAKANFAKGLNATIPIICDEKIIDLKKARHPLIDKDIVVPIDIKIGGEYSSLIITGPNTGGKTVTLKTCGLLCLMAYSGLFIPVDSENESRIYIFDNIFADIGDEQSIQESLSTFSSHMTNIVGIVNSATENSLILIDELGSGTDPLEGASLAISILEYFNKLGAFCLTTTHYSEIKNYALVTDGFENASVTFDVENLKPTYQLLIGIPGKSNAFAISKKLGLNDKLLERAQNFLKEDNIHVEELLKNIYDDKIIIENEKKEIEKNKNQIELLRKNLEQERNKEQQQKNEKQEKAKIEAKNIVLAAKEKANDVIRGLNDIYDNLKDFENLDIEHLSDTEIANFVKLHFRKESLKNANLLRNKLNTSLDSIVSNDSDLHTLNKRINPSDLKTGMQVKLSNISELATIISINSKNVQVQVGSAKINVKLSNIEGIIPSKPSNKVTYSKESGNRKLQSQKCFY